MADGQLSKAWSVQPQNRICWLVMILFTVAYTEANTGCSPILGGICVAGFPSHLFVMSDAGGLQPFDWPVGVMNAVIGIFAVLLLLWLLWGGNGRRWLQYSSGALFTAAFTWANPILLRLTAADPQLRRGFVDATAIDAGFPFTFRSSATAGISVSHLLLNILIGLVCVELIYRMFERSQEMSRPRPHAMRRWVTILAPVCLYAWIIRFAPFRLSRLWQNVGFAYTVTESGFGVQRWFVRGTDVAIGALLVVLVFVITAQAFEPRDIHHRIYMGQL